MRLLKRWRYLLIAFILFGIAGMAVAYVRSPDFRAAQAYARIHEGMSRDAARRILAEWGGEYPGKGQGHQIIRGLVFDDASDIFWFGSESSVCFEWGPDSTDPKRMVVTKKDLRQTTFTEWVSGFFDSFKAKTTVKEGVGFAVGTGATPATESNADDRIQELLNDPETQKQIREEWRRFKELDSQTPSTNK
jgi:hypothetical protein